MKKEYWKYVSVTLSILSVVLLVYSLVFSSAMALKPENISISTGTSAPTLDITPSIIIPTAVDPLNTDQVQDPTDVCYYIGYLGGNNGCYKQLIVNDREPYIGFSVAIGKHGTPTEPLLIGVLKIGNEGFESPLDGDNYHALGGISPDINIPDDQLVWIDADFASMPYNKKQVNIAAVSTDDPTDGNYWFWGAMSGNPYQDDAPGNIHDTPGQWHWANERWGIGGMDDEDFAFITYTEGGTGGEPPSINIVVNTLVTTTSGILCLIGACFSGIKYGVLVGWV